MPAEKNIIPEDVYKIVVEEASILAALYTGPEMRIKIANKLMLKAWGKDSSVIGKTAREANHEWEGQPFFGYLDEVFQTGVEHVSVEEKAVLVSEGGVHEYYYTFNYKPLKRADGSVWGIVHTAIDVTAQVEAKKAMEESEQRLHLAIQNSEAGIFDIDIRGGKVVRSGNHARIFGYPDNSGDWDVDKFKSHLLEKDKLAYEAIFKSGIETGRFEAALRIRRTDNEIRWVNIIGKFQYRDCVAVRLTGTITDITEKKEIQQQKDEFISTVSHEVKTPLTSIKAYAQFLHKSSTEEKQVANRVFLDRMLMQIKRLEKLVATLFDATRVEAGKLLLNSASFEMSNMLSELVHELQMQNPSHELMVLKNETLEIVADKERIEQVLTNFIVNAVKYSPGAAKIYILSYVQDGQLICSVQDFGKGISDAQKPYVFERFHQVSKKDMNIGLGLGLYICREIINREGGQIWFDSSVGEGSTFFFSLPLTTSGDRGSDRRSD